MKAFKAVAATLFFCLAFTRFAPAADEFRGSWTIRPAEDAGNLYFGLARRHAGSSMNSESDWPRSVFQGLDLATTARHDVSFHITRDAGRIDCEGYLEQGEGAGTFRFTPDGGYVQAMGALGFAGIEAEEQFAMAVHDVSLEFARQMKSQEPGGLTTDKLIALRFFDGEIHP